MRMSTEPTIPIWTMTIEVRPKTPVEVVLPGLADRLQAGTPISAYDLLIAAQAARRNITLLTANVREFSRVPCLHCRNWNKP